MPHYLWGKYLFWPIDIDIAVLLMLLLELVDAEVRNDCGFLLLAFAIS
ncbi:hypothetical protein SynRS9915_00070 [Synechococcus sp. RS9915]|nr:hypothetical protein SynRS9915_00070 [Synechococcus sp. RS9915]